MRAVISATSRSPARSSTRRASLATKRRRATGPASRRSGSKRETRQEPERLLVPEIAELHRDLGNGFFRQCDRILQIILLGARHAHRIALDARLDLELGILDRLH